MSTHYDLAIIGSGSGNTLITPFWNDKKVALFEDGVFGGTCLNRGCIPTKMFTVPATLATSAQESGKLGVDLKLVSTDWPAIRDRVFGRVDAISESGRAYRADQNQNVDLYEERAVLVSPHEIRTASGESITADQVVIAAGSRPRIPDVPGTELPGVHTSDTIMRLPSLPRRVLVVGAGSIGAEFSTIFSGLGSEVIQVARGPELLRHMDPTIAQRFTQAASQRWDVHRGWDLSSIGEGAEGLEARFTRGDETLALEADVVLLATGRIPNSDSVGAAAAGLDVTTDGTIEVDQYLQVLADGKPVPGVYALGDIAGPVELKHVANREARVVSYNLEHPDHLRAADLSAIPEAIFSDPQVATVGLTETQAREHADRPEDITVGVYEYGDTAYGWALDDHEGFVKVIADSASGKILGAHIMGAEASILIQPLTQGMAFGTDAYSLARTPFWPHPALTEVVENALLQLDVPVPENAPL